jgi:hypothetical protein
MKRIGTVVLLAIVSAASVLPAHGRYNNHYQQSRAARKAAKKQQKASKRYSKQQQKAIKKAAKAQRKALKQTRRRAAR